MSELVIDWGKFIEAQKQLDNYIFELKGLNYSLTNKKRKLALIVELYELVNESKVFKFWSNQPAIKEKLLLEYIDLIHLSLSLSIDYDIQLPNRTWPENNKKNPDDLLDFFINLHQKIHTIIEKHSFTTWFNKLMDLGSYLGFTFEEVETAYFKKVEINFERQKQNY